VAGAPVKAYASVDTCPVIAYDAVAGGRAQRLGGVDKPMTAIAGIPMLVLVLTAVGTARTLVVVGPRRELPQFADRLRWTRENPEGSGPVAAVAAGIAALDQPAALVMVLAADLPFVGAAVDPLLTAAASSEMDGAMLIDGSGRDQPLAAVYRSDAIRRRLASIGSPVDVAVRDLVRSMRLVRVRSDDASLDCDTWADVRRADARATGRTR
jgi:molybdopterin-guanine dinucleotide biosynthesis protein A